MSIIDIIFSYPSSEWAIGYNLTSLKDFLANVCYFRFIQHFLWVATSDNLHKSLGSRMLHWYPNLVLQQDHENLNFL